MKRKPWRLEHRATNFPTDVYCPWIRDANYGTVEAARARLDEDMGWKFLYLFHMPMNTYEWRVIHRTTGEVVAL